MFNKKQLRHFLGLNSKKNVHKRSPPKKSGHKQNTPSKQIPEKFYDVRLPESNKQLEVKEEALPKRPYRDSQKEFLKIFRRLTYARSSWEVWNDFVVMFACAISNSVDNAHFDERENIYLKTINKYNKTEQKPFPELAAETVMALDQNSEQDFLGQMFMDLNLGNKSGCQFFTPYHVSELMAKITLGDIIKKVEAEGYISISDSCCGGGAMLIAAVNEAKKILEKNCFNFQNRVFVVAQDIDRTAALMCYIQLSLLGVAGYVKIGNSLTEPICDGDSLENYWFTPMYFSEVWTFRRLFHNVFKEKEADDKCQ